jgi:hypothetical protein
MTAEEEEIIQLLMELERSTDALMVGLWILIACMGLILVYLAYDLMNKKNMI